MRVVGYRISMADLYRLLGEKGWTNEDTVETLYREGVYLEMPIDMLVKVEDRKASADYARSAWWNYRA
jgi:hypothetical protein